MIRECRTCGRRYESSYACDQRRSWRALACSQEHYGLLITVMEYLTDHDADKAYAVLCSRGFDFEDLEGYLPSVRKALAEISANASAACGSEQRLTDLGVGKAKACAE